MIMAPGRPERAPYRRIREHATARQVSTAARTSRRTLSLPVDEATQRCAEPLVRRGSQTADVVRLVSGPCDVAVGAQQAGRARARARASRPRRSRRTGPGAGAGRWWSSRPADGCLRRCGAAAHLRLDHAGGGRVRGAAGAMVRTFLPGCHARLLCSLQSEAGSGRRTALDGLPGRQGGEGAGRNSPASPQG
jgi:hypothetical protein